jgi:hypothetical protein
MNRSRTKRAALVLVALVGAAVVYVVWIPVHAADADRLRSLIVSHPATGFVARPEDAEPVPTGSSPFAEVKTAARQTPEGTGGYSVEWKGKVDKKAIASVLLTLLPSTHAAGKVRAQAVKEYLEPTTLQTAGYTLGPRFSVTSVPGARGATFLPASGSTSTEPTSAVVLRVHHAVAVAVVETKQSAVRSEVSALARDEYRLLARTATGFSLASTTAPLVASVVYWGVVVVLIAATLTAPSVVRTVRRRRRVAREEALRRQRLSRGRKVVKRRARTW